MHNFINRVSTYFTFQMDEVIGLLVTSLFAGFIFTFNEWGDESFDAAAGVQALAVMFLFLLFVLALVVLISKLICLKFGYQLTYQPHLVGMMGGLVIAVASNGYLPIFLPGGYQLRQPVRMYVGHWRGYQRTWANPIMASMFPILLILAIYCVNILYILTGAELFVKMFVALALTAIYSLIPLPNIALEYGGRVMDFFRYLKGTTFGLEIFFNSRTTYVLLSVFVLFFTGISYLMTIAGKQIGLVVYIVSLIIGLLCLFLYKNFIENIAGGFRT